MTPVLRAVIFESSAETVPDFDEESNPLPDPANAASLTDRTDLDIEAIVNRGLATAILVDLEAGVAFMRDSGVPMGVVSRVLLDPSRRRNTDWQGKPHISH
ncbi:MAG: hypothetical protein V4805_13075 [Pseudomonadota bacterium]